MNRIAEFSVITSMLLSPTAKALATTNCRKDDFSEPLGYLFEALANLPPADSWELSQAIGKAYCVPENIKEYIKILKGDLPEVHA